MRLWVAALLLLFCIPTYAIQFPSSWPTSFDDLDVEVDAPLFAVYWETTTGGYCLGGNFLNAPNVTIPEKLSGESITEYMERNKAVFITRQLTAEENALCVTLFARNKEVWLVTPWRDKPNRNVYEITDAFPGTKKKIGEVAVGTKCGVKVAAYSVKIKILEWRKVTIPEGEGATVCKKQ